MVEDIEQLKAELEYYKKKLSIGEHDLSLSGYISYVGLVKQQVDFIKDFKIRDNIDGKKSETALYDRAMSIGEGLPKMILAMQNLKMELKIEYNEQEGKEKAKATTPQSLVKRD